MSIRPKDCSCRKRCNSITVHDRSAQRVSNHYVINPGFETLGIPMIGKLKFPIGVEWRDVHR